MSTHPNPGYAPVTSATPARAFWIPLVVAVLSIAAGLALVWSVRDQLPDPVASHWGADGKPDGFSSLRSQMVFGTIFPLVMAALMMVIGAATRQLRALAPVVAGMTVFLSTIFFGGTWAQRGQQAATTAEASWPMWAGMIGGIVVGLLVWQVTRDSAVHRAQHGPAASTPRVPVAPGSRVAWTGHTRTGRGIWISAVVGTVPTVAMGVLFCALGNVSLGVFMFVLTVTLAVLMSNLWCRVSIDSRGVRTLGFGVIPWIRLPLEQIEQASLDDVNPLGDFGGWGYRSKHDGSGAWGLVTAEGPAVVIERAGKGPLYLTVEHADEAAAVLNTLLAQCSPVVTR